LFVDITRTASTVNTFPIRVANGGANVFTVRYDGYTVGSQAVFGNVGLADAGPGVIRLYGASGAISFNAEIELIRDAANTLAQRNGTNAQTFRIYNTFTDASNYERGFMRWSSNVLQIGTEAAGTGGARAVNIQSANTVTLGNGGTGFLVINATNAGLVNIDGSGNIYGSGFFAAPEIADPAAPATNTGRLYYRDNGSGKTQLCVRFATGAVQVLATEP
jgi:hypothetical protein